MSTVRRYNEYRGGVQYSGGTQITKDFFPYGIEYPPKVPKISPPPTALMVFPHKPLVIVIFSFWVPSWWSEFLLTVLSPFLLFGTLYFDFFPATSDKYIMYLLTKAPFQPSKQPNTKRTADAQVNNTDWTSFARMGTRLSNITRNIKIIVFKKS